MMEPQVQYVRSVDGTTIAYYELGDGVPLILSPHLWSHLGATWEMVGEATMRLVKEGFRFIRYDMRGMGLSDRDVEDFSLDAQVADIEALRGHLGLERFALLGVVFSTPVCLAYAARYPERLTHLIVITPIADGEAWYRRWPTLQGLESFRAFGDEQWQLYVRAHATTLAGMLQTGDPEEMTGIMMQSASPRSLSAYLTALRQQNVVALLGDIRTPTLAMTSGDLELEASAAQVVVAGIAGARLTRIAREPSAFDIPGAHHVPHIVRFVLDRELSADVDRSAPPEGIPPAQGTAVILFTDIVDSTALTERMGDAAYRALSRSVDERVRAAMRAHRGTVVEGKVLGDGVMGVFSLASQAIAAARACVDIGQELPMHVGLHAGDVTHEAGNVYGGTVNIASRICGLSAPGEILVSDVVRGMARTSAGVVFEDRGEQEMKGVGEAVRVYAVRGQG